MTTYTCPGCDVTRCATCDPPACPHGHDLCGWCAAGECGACKTDQAWENVTDINVRRNKA